MKRFILSILLVVLFVACQQDQTTGTSGMSQEPPGTPEQPGPEQPGPEQPGPEQPGPEQPAAEPGDEPVHGQIGDGKPAELLPAPPEDASRTRRRMDIDQLDKAIQRVSGGIAWTKGNKNQFEVLARTLGKPDYIDLTNEDLEPSALFQKFLDDAARTVCTELSQKELGILAKDRVLMVHVTPTDTYVTNPEGVDKNLQLLVLRYHGRNVTVASPELEQWRWLFKSAVFVSEDPVTAWHTVCVGLITHPYFYTY